ncbi:hypothetical protein TNCV_4049121 [Trichonephila clavipes]|nr:hypothetical protein TNCV_4049121 [Trichonephila clavipes]
MASLIWANLSKENHSSKISQVTFGMFELLLLLLQTRHGRGSLVVKVSDCGWYIMSSSPVPIKTYRGGERCTLNLSKAQASSRWCSVVVRRLGTSSGVVLVT